QAAIDPRRYGEELRRSDFEDRRKLPTAANQLQCPVREPGRLKNSRQIEYMTLIPGLAVAPVCPAAAGKVEAVQKMSPTVADAMRADAMRPGMVCKDAHAPVQPLLNVYQ